MRYTKTQAVIDMLKEWPEGETRNIRTMRQKAEELYHGNGETGEMMETFVSARLRERREIFGISSMQGIGVYRKEVKGGM